MIKQVTVNTVCVAFVFPDIRHQPGTEEAAKETVKDHGFLEIGMVSVGERPRNTYSRLYAFRIIDDVTLLLRCWLRGVPHGCYFLPV
jgi:hypothetical protein